MPQPDRPVPADPPRPVLARHVSTGYHFFFDRPSFEAWRKTQETGYFTASPVSVLDVTVHGEDEGDAKD